MLILLFAFLTLDSEVLEPEWRAELSRWEIYRARVLAVSDQGEVAVIDRDQPRVLILDGTGAFKTWIDKAGEGPGELQGPIEIGWSRPHQAFAVLDFANSRVSLWKTDGTLVREAPISGTLFHPRFIAEDKMLLLRNPGGMNAEPALILWTLGESEAQELFRHAMRPKEWSTGGDPENPFRIRYRWDPALWYGLGGDFAAVAFGDEAKIRLIALDGSRHAPSINVRIPSFQVSDDQLEEGIALLPATLHASMRQGLIRPEFWPPIRAVHVDPKDRIWVIGGSRDVGRPHPVRVYSVDGNLQKETWVAQVPLDVSTSALYYLDQDEEDNLAVVKVRYQL